MQVTNRSAKEGMNVCKQMGLIDPKWQLSPQKGNWVKVKHPPWESRCMEVYAAMIHVHGSRGRPHYRISGTRTVA